MNGEIFCIILSLPHNNVLDLNNVMLALDPPIHYIINPKFSIIRTNL